MHSLPSPSFAADAPPSLPRLPEYAGIQDVRTGLIAAAGTLCDLVMGPDEVIITKVFLVSVFFFWLAGHLHVQFPTYTAETDCHNSSIVQA